MKEKIEFRGIDATGEGIVIALEGMRLPKNSGSRFDSCTSNGKVYVGRNDYRLATSLIMAGPEHCKFMRMIPVWIDITAPRYFWQEFDTYKIGVVENSQSTMHKIGDISFNVDDDFEYERGLDADADECIDNLLRAMEKVREKKEDAETTAEADKYHMLLKGMMPEGLLQRRMVFTNYAQLANIYHQRHNHKVPTWRTLCSKIEELPFSEFITGKFDK